MESQTDAYGTVIYGYDLWNGSTTLDIATMLITTTSTTNELQAYDVEESNVTENVTLLKDNYEELPFEVKRMIYMIIVPVLSFSCYTFSLVNTVIAASVFWVRRPISPTIHLSLSLAGSDAFLLFILGSTLFLNSLLPTYGIQLFHECTLLALEGFRLGGIITTLGHLLALSVNHYLGITKPLHYRSIMTRRNITIIILSLWIIPPSMLIIYFFLLDNDGFSTLSSGCTHFFLERYRFRSIYSYVVFGSFIVMAAIYSHIYRIVIKNQEMRNRFRRAGSMYSQSRNNSQKNNDDLTEKIKNEKALFTTILIVGSVMFGMIPVTIIFYLICEDCFVKIRSIPQSISLLLFTIGNTLMLIKTCLNCYIFAARMQEIKVALRRMKIKIIKSLCYSCYQNDNDIDIVQSEFSIRNNYAVSRNSSLRRSHKNATVTRLQTIQANDHNDSILVTEL